jgi:hypothetical protein
MLTSGIKAPANSRRRGPAYAIHSATTHNAHHNSKEKSMKSVIAALMLLSFAHVASADIPMPHTQSGISTRMYAGQPAAEKWSSMSSLQVVQRGNSGWDGSTFETKVERSQDGLQQTICKKSSNSRTNSTPTFSCTVQTSLNGQPLPKLQSEVRMG